MKRLWLDADPSGFVWTGLDCDDDLAILAALAQHGNILQGISVCGGNAPFKHTFEDMQLLLRHAGMEECTILPGFGWNSMQVLGRLLNFFAAISPDVQDSLEASKAMIRAAQQGSPNSLTMLMLGPCTNLAKAIEMEPSFSNHLDQVVLMGGELTGQRMDLNFLSDRASARAVIQANVSTTIVPIQTCGQVVVTSDVVDRFVQHCCPRAAACALAPKMRLQVLAMPWLVNRAVRRKYNQNWHPSPNLESGFIPWDVVALLALARPDMFDDWKWHRIHMPSCEEGEPCDGTMQVLETSTKPPNYDFQDWVQVPHKVHNETQLLEYVFMDLLCELPAAATTDAPTFLWGFLGHILATVALVLLSWFFVSAWIVYKWQVHRRNKIQKPKQH